jgi:hypothetical protein
MLSTFARTYREGDDRAKQWLAPAEYHADPELVQTDSAGLNPAVDPDVADLMPDHAPPSVYTGD